jgi:hypothetical protein
MTDRPSIKLRAQLFFYGNANLLGCALALLGPLLLFLGVIGPGWLLITAGLYAAGYLLAPKPLRFEQGLVQRLSHEQTLERLDELVAQAKPQLAAEQQQHLSSVRDSVAEMLPRLAGELGHDDTLFTVRETVFSYLPQTLQNYLALPPAFRATQTLPGGKTARQLLDEQLRLLDSKMRELLANLVAHDAHALQANGQFLKSRFQQPEFLVR